MRIRNWLRRPVRAATIVLAVTCLAACSPPQASQANAIPEVAKSAPPASSPDLARPRTACWLLPGATVSKILGQSLTPSADLGAIQYGNTSCNYYRPGSDPEDDAPRLTVTLDWNGYNLMAMDIPQGGPATAAAPYADIGDGALLKGGVLFIRSGGHSVAMDLRGEGDLHAIASRLIAAAQPRLTP